MSQPQNPATTGLSRRRFLGSIGAGAAASAVASVPGVSAAPAAAPPYQPPAGHFGRMFPKLPGFAESSPKLAAALAEIGRPGGIMDARDPLALGPKKLITDAAAQKNNPDNPYHTAGTTFVAQFLAHDITFDVSSQLGKVSAPEVAQNMRTPAFDLDSVFGGGPFASPQLYDANDYVKLRIDHGGLYEDLPRTDAGQAITGDPRNDETVIIAGLHLAAALFHNHAVDLVRSQKKVETAGDVFAAARQLTVWHYQWLIRHEFLPLFIGPRMVEVIENSRNRFYNPAKGQPFLPVEFSAAAYRFGHSMTRPSYRANLTGDHGEPFFGMLFDPSEEGKVDPGDMRGGARAPRRYIDWQTFFDFGDGQVKRDKRIDTRLSTPLFNLPLGAIASHDHPTSLAQRDLMRHVTWSIPSGQAIARALDLPSLSTGDLDELKPFGVGLEQSTPLWYYILKEADVMADGQHLGPVGGRIVGEVILGLLHNDPNGYLAQPIWSPNLPSRAGAGQFTMVDFLTFARVDPASRREMARMVS